MKVIERKTTICGETHFVGVPCALIRFAGCSIRCTWCDTTYAYEGGEEISPDSLMQWVEGTGLKLVLLTGGEPLLQNDLPYLALKLAERHLVLVETSGTQDIRGLAPPIIRSVDIKCPGSGQEQHNFWQNMEDLRAGDAVKLVLASRQDYEYGKKVISRYRLGWPIVVLLSSACPFLAAEELAHWIIEDKLADVRLNIQAHRLLWPKLENVPQPI